MDPIFGTDMKHQVVIFLNQRSLEATKFINSDKLFLEVTNYWNYFKKINLPIFNLL